MGPGALESGEGELKAWLLYATAKLALYDKAPPPPSNGSAEDFALELGAREALAEHWAAERAGAQRPNAEFDRLVEIWRAGFLPEYVIAWTRQSQAATLARLELNVALEEVLGRHPRFGIAETGEARRAVYPANGWVNLPITFG